MVGETTLSNQTSISEMFQFQGPGRDERGDDGRPALEPFAGDAARANIQSRVLAFGGRLQNYLPGVEQFRNHRMEDVWKSNKYVS